MKRNPDLIRDLLLYFESKPDDKVAIDLQIDGFTRSEVGYHLILMHEAGLIRAERVLTRTGRVIRVLPFSLSWQGHELLDAARSATTWKRAKSLVLKKSGAFSFELLKAALLGMAKAKLGLPGV